jgi:predicted HTH domain antitoxin
MRWEFTQLCKLSEEQPVLADKTLQVLRQHQPDIWQQLVIRAYLDQQISLSKAAELLDMTRLELQRHFLQQGIPVRMLSLDEVQAEVETLRQGQ